MRRDHVGSIKFPHFTGMKGQDATGSKVMLREAVPVARNGHAGSTQEETGGYLSGTKRAFPEAQGVTGPPVTQESQVQSLGWEGPREGLGYPLQCYGLKNPMGRGAWQDPVHGSQRVRHSSPTNTSTFKEIQLRDLAED